MKKYILLSLFLLGCSTPEFSLPSTMNGSRYPRVSATENGGLLMSWFEKVDSVQWALQWSEFSKGTWTEGQTITSGDPYFVNWADFPSIYEVGGDQLVSHWLQKSGNGPYDYNVQISHSKDRGKSWSESVIPHGDIDPKGEHGFLSFFQQQDASLGFVWLDGRHMGAYDPVTHSMGDMALYHSTMVDGQLGTEAMLDNRVCECCPTSSIQTGNSLIIAYRDRSEKEIRDINIIRYADGKWFEPYPVHEDNWLIGGCPVNGPMLAANGNDLAIAWYTSPNETPTVNVAFSHNDGASFSAPIRVDLSKPIGRVDLTWISQTEVMVSWIEMAEETTDIVTSIVSKSGNVQTPRIVSEIQPGRVSGYPQMEIVDDQLFFAWTEGGENGRVMTQWVSLSAFR
ncbi:MAG: hypothetical protein HOA15_03450 [Candidatus Marinimicrobia bacterium]|nr:hypothetical protein [Candidatus Neomarinimicrobiota bacterium]MBT3675563.1 hypothetical protein [Candidatus Neomarinimicrobiota bacterium]MBT3763360.1 hypothetical protein [Candidatus Neomarinimicrobiota bacterium]MBT4069072.1 hypothetical protein [Candidatus Neomarinimicrobiota bacterium]MBT4270230.1 hypothetical protein [Candidatus Neomarinimicrobiota bacterium]